MQWLYRPGLPPDMANSRGNLRLCYLDHSFVNRTGAVSRKEMQDKDHMRFCPAIYTLEYITDLGACLRIADLYPKAALRILDLSKSGRNKCSDAATLEQVARDLHKQKMVSECLPR
jgi:hypothetical protein